MKRVIGFICILLGLLVGLFVLYKNSQYSQVTRTFSPYTLLASSWDEYKQQFLTNDGRIMDLQQNNITTSEGQSYALLRSVWSDDKPTFDLVWKFTQDNLKRPSDNLFAWQWGKRPDGSYGVMPNGGVNTASDADSDIAFALILASRRWGDGSYLDSAKKILPDLWKIDTADGAGSRYLIAGNWAQNQNELVINPSYFAPYEWRVFATVDPQDNWNAMVNPAYALLNKSGQDPLNKGHAVGLPPDWLSLNRNNGSIKETNLDKLTTNYSYDAIRIPWRVALDYQWNKDPQALTFLTSSFKFLADYYSQNGKLMSIYSHDGVPLSNVESPVMYATALGYFINADPNTASKVYQDKIIRLYSNAQNSFDKSLPYYDQNWLWFGAALYNKSLVLY